MNQDLLSCVSDQLKIIDPISINFLRGTCKEWYAWVKPYTLDKHLMQSWTKIKHRIIELIHWIWEFREIKGIHYYGSETLIIQLKTSSIMHLQDIQIDLKNFLVILFNFSDPSSTKMMTKTKLCHILDPNIESIYDQSKNRFVPLGKPRALLTMAQKEIPLVTHRMRHQNKIDEIIHTNPVDVQSINQLIKNFILVDTNQNRSSE